MSWDIIVINLPPGIKIPGRDAQELSAILRIAWCSIKFSMGSREEVDSFAMHVRGGNECPNIVAHVLDGLGMRALDTSSESGLFEQDPKLRSKSFERWRSFRSQVQDQLDHNK